MRETEIRSILGHVCRELDARARRSAASAMLGASLLVTAGCSDDPGLKQDGGTQADGGAVPAYMAPVDASGAGGQDTSPPEQSTGGKVQATGGRNTGGQSTGGQSTGGQDTLPPAQSAGGAAGMPPDDNTGGAQIPSTGGTAGSGAAGAEGISDVCEIALPLRCGDRLAHSTTVQGHPNQWTGYNCTQRWEAGRETVYHFASDQDCTVTARIVDLTTDLDVFMAECDPGSCGSCSSVIENGWVNAEECSSIPLGLQAHFVEEIAFDVVAGQGRAVLVDGYDYDEGTYTIEVDCTCS